MENIYRNGLEKILSAKRQQTKLKSWFLYQEIKMQEREKLAGEGIDPDAAESQAVILCECIKRMPLSIPEGSVIAGTQDDAFSPSYALINPTFKVESFAGYCDPLAVYNDIEPDNEISQARIDTVRSYFANTPYVKSLSAIYDTIENDIAEVAYFVEPVTGHIIPDLRGIIRQGTEKFASSAPDKSEYSASIKNSLKAVNILAERYADLADKLLKERNDKAEQFRLTQILRNCSNVPAKGAQNLHEAVQSFALLWQVMCLEQGPNPYAFSVGNLDRILQPYLKDCPEDVAVLLVRHLLAFFMVGDRCWAISQNIMLGGRDEKGRDLTNDMTYIVLKAFYDSNNPQPALSVKLHSRTPIKMYQEMGKFLFTSGHSTPSTFNDDELFEVLKRKGITEPDLPDYAIAGCQEPLIMGKEAGNTTNSWLNLAKILELTLNDGKSLISGKQIGLTCSQLGYKNIADVYAHLEEAFFTHLDHFLDNMKTSANACVTNLGNQAVPFSSALMSCLETGRDYRNPKSPGTKYHGSGCLIHGLSVLTDSFVAVDRFLANNIDQPEKLLEALKQDFKDHGKILDFLLAQDKYGNNLKEIDSLAAKLAKKICFRISTLKNPAGSPFHPDFSTPSTHLLYGYWVGATPDGRHAREMLGYGIDPRPGMATRGVQDRIMSARNMPFNEISGGYSSHLGLAPHDFTKYKTKEEKGVALKNQLIDPLFAFGSDQPGGYYMYFNIDNSDNLREVLKNPEKHAPNGIYIMRIHGTFVNFLDLSPAIQEDIIARLDPESTAL